jgi:ATP-binding protein involved in chromosome partitioning
MSKLSEKQIIDELSQIIDADLNKTLGKLNGIEKVVIKDSTVQVYANLIQPIQWVYPKIKEEIIGILNKIAPDYNHEVFIDEAEMPENKRDFLKNVKNIIAVSSGKGGVGKSAVASNLAAALSLKGAKVGVLDADVYGPSQPTMFGLSGLQMHAAPGPDGKPLAIPLEKYGIKVASMGFLMDRTQAAIVRGPMLAGYFTMLFEQVEWGHLDFIIFDLPPGTGDIQLTLTQKIPLTGAVVVTTPQEISLADVRRSINMFEKVNVDVLGIVENMSYFTPPELPDKKYYIFGEGGGKRVAYEANTEFLGEVPLDINMREANDGGKPIVMTEGENKQADILKEITANIVCEVRKKNYQKMADKPVEIDI